LNTKTFNIGFISLFSFFFDKASNLRSNAKESLSYGLSQSSIYQKNPLTQKLQNTPPIVNKMNHT